MKRNEMKTHTFFNTIKYSAFLIAAFIFVSCQNGITEKNTTEKVSQKGRIVVSANATTVSREAANPDLSLSNFSDFKLYASTAALPANLESLNPIASGNTVEELNDPAIELDAGIWNFALSASLNGVSFSGTNNNFEVSSGSTNTISFTLTPDIDGGGLEVTITFPSEADRVHIKLEPAAGGSAVIDEDATTFETSGSQKSLTVSRNISNALERIAPGTYKLIYSFYVSDITDALNSCEFIVNIAAGITTSKTDFVISDLNETHEITYQYKYFTVGKESGETIDVSSLLTEDDEPIILPVKYFRKSNISNTTLPVLKNYTAGGKTYSFAGWYNSSDPEMCHHNILSKFQDIGSNLDSDISLIACFTDTFYVSQTNTDAQQYAFTAGFYSDYPCYDLDDAIDAIKRIQMKSTKDEDSNVDWKIIIDGQTGGAGLKDIYGKSLTLQGKTGSDTDIIEGDHADLADNLEIFAYDEVLLVQTGFPVFISKLKITHGGRAIALYAERDPSGGYRTTELTLQSDTKIVDNIGADEAGAIYLMGTLGGKAILNIEDGVVISNNISRGFETPSLIGMGGAIGAVNSNCEINMSGGEITNNTAYNWGGGIYLYGATLNLSGGTISGNNVSFLGSTPNSVGQMGGAIYKTANATINIQGEAYIPYADNKNDIYLADGAINLSGEIFNYDNQVQEFAITIADPTETSRIVLTQSDEGGKYVMGFHQMFIPTVAGYEIDPDGKWAPKTDTPYTVYHYKQPDNGSTTLTEYQLADTDDESGTTGVSTNATAKSYAGFTAQTFSQSTIAGDGSTEIYIYYDRDNITYTFNKATGEVWESDSETGTRSGLYETSFTPPTITRTGYNFDKWKTADDEELASPYTFGAQNKTYNASWTAKAYTIQYELDGGTNNPDNPTTYSILSAITLKAPTKEGAVFDGWYTNAGFTTSITQIAIGTYQSGNTPLTLYAKWKYSTDINVSINTSSNSQLSMAVTVDGEPVEANETISAKYSATTGKTIIFTPTLPESGYTCVWKVDEKSSMTGMSVNNTSKVLTIDTTGWLPGVYDVQLRASKDSTYESYYAQIKIQGPLGAKAAPNAVGDIVFNDGTATAYTEGMTLSDEQKAAAVAVIFYAGNDIFHDDTNRVLGIGLKNSWGSSTKTYIWANENTAGCTNLIGNLKVSRSTTQPSGEPYYSYKEGIYTYYLTGAINGSNSWQALYEATVTLMAEDEQQLPENYPAFDYAKNYAINAGLTGTYATGWYMPSIAELQNIYSNKTQLETILTSLGGDTLLGNYYWSSSQTSEATKAWQLRISDGSISSYDKDVSQYVCVIREF